MQIRLQTQPIHDIAADWLVLGLFQDDSSETEAGLLGKSFGEQVAQLRASKDFEGKPNEQLTLFSAPGFAARRVLLLGLGKREKASRMTLTRAASAACRSISSKQYQSVAIPVLGHGLEKLSLDERCEAVVTGALLGVEGQDKLKTEKVRFPMEELILVGAPSEEGTLKAAIERGQIVGESVNLARSLVNQPPADLYPETFCAVAEGYARELGLESEAFSAQQLWEKGMQCILAVGQGSSRPPRLLRLSYKGNPSAGAKTLCLVGKGITFDSGGLCIKPADSMLDMKCDMAGAASVVAATVAIARLKLPVNVLCLAPLAENMPSATAFRTGDILRAYNGKTIEIINTDAEGRLVLADALSYAVELGASHIVDLATLTGACMVALGNHVGGLMTNNDPWCDRVVAATERSGELAWKLPMYDVYDEPIKSSVADIKNSGGRWGGAITAAKLLVQFVGETPWVHVDIAGPAFTDKDSPYQDGGGTGYFVRTLIELAKNYES